MSVPPGPPQRFLGLKITSNRIEAVLIMFTFTCLSLILYGNNLIDASKFVISIGLILAVYLWVFKKPESPY